LLDNGDDELKTIPLALDIKIEFLEAAENIDITPIKIT